MAKRYSIEFEVTVDLVIHDDDVIDRVVRETGDFKNFPYYFKGDKEHAAVEMLARCMGIQDSRLSALDGWADLPDSAVTVANVDIIDRHIDGPEESL